MRDLAVTRLSCAVFAVIAMLSLLIVSPAAAHTYLVASSPAGGAVVKDAPTEVVLNFSETVSVVEIKIVSEAGALVPIAVQADGKAVKLTPTFAQPADGVYIVRWSIVGEDSHNIEGAIAFRVGDGPPPPIPADASGPGGGDTVTVEPSKKDATLVGSVILRTALTLSLLISAGATIFEAAFSQPSYVPVRSAALVSLVALAAEMVLKSAIIGFALTPKLGSALIAAGLLAVMSRGRPIALAGAVLAIAGLSFWGHAVIGARLVGQPLQVLHLLAAAFWLGSLWPLYNVATRGVEVEPVIRRFSRLAAPVVAGLIAAGLLLAWMRVGLVGIEAPSAYGLVLAGKILLVFPLIGLALWNRLVLTARLPASGPLLARSIDIELVLMTLVVFAAGWLAWLPPPGE